MSIIVYKFTPEKYWLYKPKVKLAKFLWYLAYKIHPYPSKFHEEVATNYLEARKWAEDTLKKIESNMKRITGIEE